MHSVVLAKACCRRASIYRKPSRFNTPHDTGGSSLHRPGWIRECSVWDCAYSGLWLLLYESRAIHAASFLVWVLRFIHTHTFSHLHTHKHMYSHSHKLNGEFNLLSGTIKRNDLDVILYVCVSLLIFWGPLVLKSPAYLSKQELFIYLICFLFATMKMPLQAVAWLWGWNPKVSFMPGAAMDSGKDPEEPCRRWSLFLLLNYIGAHSYRRWRDRDVAISNTLMTEGTEEPWWSHDR